MTSVSFRIFLQRNNPHIFISNKCKTTQNAVFISSLHTAPTTLARKSSQLPQVYDVSEENITGPIKPAQHEKFKPLPLAPIPDQKLIEYANFCFEKPAKFIGSVGDSTPEGNAAKWPNKTLPEIAFMGVSNAGKSTLINSLLNTKDLAKTSKKPGHTKLLNLFQVGGRFVLVDMPGYGYKSRESWGAMVEKYLKDGVSEKGQLKRVFLLIESKRNFKHYDKMIMELLEKSNVPYQVVITKADKLPPSYWDEAYLSPTSSELALFLRQRGQSLADPSLIFTSPLKARFGISQLRCQILEAADCVPSKFKLLKDQAAFTPKDISRSALITPKNERRMNPDFLSKE